MLTWAIYFCNQMKAVKSYQVGSGEQGGDCVGDELYKE